MLSLRLAVALGSLPLLVSASVSAVRTERRPQASVARRIVDSVPSPAASGASVPNLAVSPDGRVFMSWIEPADSGHALRVAWLDGDRWTAPATVRRGRDFFVNWADFPSVVSLGGERLAAHWLQRTGKSTYAYGVRIAQSRDGGRTWSSPVTPHRDSSATEHGFVALWPEGGALGAVWLDGRKYDKAGHDPSNEMMLLSTNVGADNRRGPEVRLDTRTCDCCQNSAAVTSNGPVVVYRDRTADEIRDVYITRRVKGQWTRGVPVASDSWKIAACPVNGPAVSADGRHVVVAWFAAPGDSGRVRVAFSADAGATFGAPIRVDDGQPAGRVDVSLLPDGDALVTWVERTGGESAAVRARRVRRSGATATATAGSAVTIASSTAARASGFPRFVVTGSGRTAQAVFAWTMPGRPSSVRVARASLAEFR